MLHCQSLLKSFPLADYVVVSLYRTRGKKHALPKVFDYFDYKTADLKQLVFQDEYFRTGNCTLFCFEKSANIC